MTTDWYRGIDFANCEETCAQCDLMDDGRRLIAHMGSGSAQRIRRIAIDSPFGTTIGFERLLKGLQCADVSNDGFKSRFTERYVRTRMSASHSNNLWLSRSKRDRSRFRRKSFFNKTAHVQSTVRLAIVPACICRLGEELCPAGTQSARLRQLQAARRGEALIIEAHPRMFLYSAVERIARAAGTIDCRLLDAVAGYRDKGNRGRSRRTVVYELLTKNTTWMNDSHRRIGIEGSLSDLVDSHHDFDAWLCALTAWAHHHGETLTWSGVPELRRHIVELEGHILILK